MLLIQVTRNQLHIPDGHDAQGSRVPQSESEECVRGDAALARAFEFLGKRWNGVVLGVLRGGPAGFRELSRAIGGISDSVLSDRLADLAEAGLVVRTVDEGPPVPVSYALTGARESAEPSARADRALVGGAPRPERRLSGNSGLRKSSFLLR